MEELSVGVFNEFVRMNYVGEKDVEKALQDGGIALYDGWFYEVDKEYGFPARVIADTMGMTEDFNDAVRTVVFKEGVKLDIARLIE